MTECEMKAAARSIADKMEQPCDGTKKEVEIEFNKETVCGEKVSSTPEGCPCRKKAEEAIVPKITNVKTYQPEYDLEVSVD